MWIERFYAWQIIYFYWSRHNSFFWKQDLILVANCCVSKPYLNRWNTNNNSNQTAMLLILLISYSIHGTPNNTLQTLQIPTILSKGSHKHFPSSATEFPTYFGRSNLSQFTCMLSGPTMEGSWCNHGDGRMGVEILWGIVTSCHNPPTSSTWNTASRYQV